MPGERNLEILLRDLEPVLHPEEFVYAAMPSDRPDNLAEAICTFREREAVTAILPQAVADRLGVPYTYPCRLITLNVHSSLDAVGLLAAVTAKLAAENISVNVVSAFYHDHLFVPADQASRVMMLLDQLRTAHQNRP
jgi:hypothetical protein